MTGQPKTPEQALEAKIVLAAERIAQALRTLLWEEGKAHGLSPLQVQLLASLRELPAHRRRVSHLAHEFALTQATVSDAVSTLERKGLVARETWPVDRRVSLLRLTSTGERLAARLTSWTRAVQQALLPIPREDKERTLHVLLEVIASLQQAGIVTVARMCVTCQFFQRDAHPGRKARHHCALLDLPLAEADLRVDCPDHQARTA